EMSCGSIFLDETGGYEGSSGSFNDPLGGGGGTGDDYSDIVTYWQNSVIIDDAPNESIITDIYAYLNCFNLNSGAVVTIYVDQPAANSRSTWAGSIQDPDVGHTFISIQQGDITRLVG